MSKKHLFGILGLIGLAVVGFLMFGFCCLSEDMRLALSLEGAAIEEMTIVFLVIAGGLGTVLALGRPSRLWAVFTFAMFIAAGREADLHKAFTTDSILKSNFYADPSVPIAEKAGGGIFILVLLWCAIYLLRMLVKNRARIRFSNVPLMFGLSGFGTIALGKTLDSFPRLFPFLEDFYTHNNGIFRLAEETLEMTGAVIFILCAVSALLHKKAR